MLRRTYRYFVCPNDHRGVERLTENDEPTSAARAVVTLAGMTGDKGYVSAKCGQKMRKSDVEPDPFPTSFV